MHLQSLTVRIVKRSEESMFKKLMQSHHYLGALPKIGNTLWYIALYQNKWQALLVFSAAALKCKARDDHTGIRSMMFRVKALSEIYSSESIPLS